LKLDPLLVKQRQLFVYFHTHPDRLKKMVEILEERVQARQVR
jgi:hypothetical protein